MAERKRRTQGNEQNGEWDDNDDEVMDESFDFLLELEPEIYTSAKPEARSEDEYEALISEGFWHIGIRLLEDGR